MRYEILEGLPPYGAMPEQFSFGSKGTHREGVVVRFFPDSGPTWVGNFQRGLTKFDDVMLHPNGSHVIIFAGGQGYTIDPDTRSLIKTWGGAVEIAIEFQDRRVIVLGDGLWFEAIGETGTLWRSKRISWDGMQGITLSEGRILGEAWNPDGFWVPFSVDLTTGEVEGGSYCGPDM